MTYAVFPTLAGAETAQRPIFRVIRAVTGPLFDLDLGGPVIYLEREIGRGSGVVRNEQMRWLEPAAARIQGQGPTIFYVLPLPTVLFNGTPILDNPLTAPPSRMAAWARRGVETLNLEAFRVAMGLPTVPTQPITFTLAAWLPGLMAALDITFEQHPDGQVTLQQ